ncbi:hypothetical protein Tco_1269790, partial [Tanacetum coccineum]
IDVPPGDQRHQYLRFEGLQYTEGDIADYETRFGEAVLDLDLFGALQFQLGKVRRRMSWREFILALGLHIAEEMQTAGFGLYWAMSTRDGHWLGQSLLVRYLRFFTSGRKQGAMISGGQFLAHLAELQICIELDDTWTWVALGPERQPDVVVGALEAAKDALVADEGTPAVPAPLQTVVGLSHMMSQAGVKYTSYADFQIPYERRTRRKTDNASTSTAQQDEQQPDP